MTNPHGSYGVENVQFSADDKWLVSVGGSSSNQSVCVWDWKNSPGKYFILSKHHLVNPDLIYLLESPVSSVPMKTGKLFSTICCHPTIATQFLVSSKTTITFFNLDTSTSQLLSHNPGSVEKEFGKSCGHLTYSVYLRYHHHCLSSFKYINKMDCSIKGSPSKCSVPQLEAILWSGWQMVPQRLSCLNGSQQDYWGWRMRVSLPWWRGRDLLL